VIDLVDSRSAPAGRSGEEVADVLASMPAVSACALLEHRFGVLPLLGAFFAPGDALAEVTQGRKLGAVGLFTPAPDFGWEAAAAAAERSGEGLLLRGQVRLPHAAADGSVVLVRLDSSEHRLVWLDHQAPGVEQRGARTGGPAGDAPCWLEIDGAVAGAGLVSEPVTLDPGGPLVRHLADYAGVWALAAALLARQGVRALRSAARTTTHGGKPFNSSQLVALGITEVEIEADLAAAAARRLLELPKGDVDVQASLGVAAASARALAGVAAKTETLGDLMGLEPDGPLAGPLAKSAAKSLTAFLGGALMVESELARALGIRDLPAEETGA
jgi:hypothetical protein